MQLLTFGAEQLGVRLGNACVLTCSDKDPVMPLVWRWQQCRLLLLPTTPIKADV